MHLCTGNMVAIGRAVVFYDRVVQELDVGTVQRLECEFVLSLSQPKS